MEVSVKALQSHYSNSNRLCNQPASNNRVWIPRSQLQIYHSRSLRWQGAEVVSQGVTLRSKLQQIVQGEEGMITLYKI